MLYKMYTFGIETSAKYDKIRYGYTLFEHIVYTSRAKKDSKSLSFQIHNMYNDDTTNIWNSHFGWFYKHSGGYTKTICLLYLLHSTTEKSYFLLILFK